MSEWENNGDDGPSLTGAFGFCTSLTNVNIGKCVTRIDEEAFLGSTNLTGVYFEGNAPISGDDVFFGATHATVYYLPGTTGWGSSFGGRRTALWVPQMQTSNGSPGVQTNQFGFTINWATGMTIVVEACTTLANPTWSPISTNTLIDGSSYFNDPPVVKLSQPFLPHPLAVNGCTVTVMSRRLALETEVTNGKCQQLLTDRHSPRDTG